VIEAGIYLASLVFDSADAIVGIAAQPIAPAIAFPLVEPTPGDLRPDVAYYSWNPDGTQVAYSNYADNALWTADRLNVHTRINVGLSHMPEWSPDGEKIVFQGGLGIYTIKPSGAGAKLIVRHTPDWYFGHVFWSPTASHLVFVGYPWQGRSGEPDLFRATASGREVVNLTSTPVSEILWERLGGWR
jgi:Tol biopolymer transport system component